MWLISGLQMIFQENGLSYISLLSSIYSSRETVGKPTTFFLHGGGTAGNHRGVLSEIKFGDVSSLPGIWYISLRNSLPSPPNVGPPAPLEQVKSLLQWVRSQWFFQISCIHLWLAMDLDSHRLRWVWSSKFDHEPFVSSILPSRHRGLLVEVHSAFPIYVSFFSSTERFNSNTFVAASSSASHAAVWSSVTFSAQSQHVCRRGSCEARTDSIPMV